MNHLGRNIVETKGEVKCKYVFMQIISMEVQRENSACVVASMPDVECLDNIFIFNLINSYRFYSYISYIYIKLNCIN